MDNKIPSTATQNGSTDIENLNNWQILSPIAILYFAVAVFKHIFGNFIYLLPALAVSYKSIIEHPMIWLPALLSLLLLLCLFAFFSFKMYRFRLTEDNVEIRSGIFSKKHLNLPFDRVQNVKIEQPIYYRFSNHACLQLDTAGSAKNEAKLVALKLNIAQQLKERIQRHTSNQPPIEQQDFYSDSEEKPKDTSSFETVLNKRKLSDLVIHGITSNRIWILLGGLAPFYNNIFNAIQENLLHIGLDLESLFNIETHSLLELGLFALTFTMLIMLVLVCFSVLGAIISFYGYTLTKLGDKYIRRSGLFTKHEVSMGLSRLQMVVQKQDWLDVVLKRINLHFEPIRSRHQSHGGGSSKIMVPAITPTESQSLIDDAYPTNTLNFLVSNNKFEPISKRFIVRNIVLVLMPFWALSMSVLLRQQNVLMSVLVSFLFIGLCGLVVQRWKRWGIAMDDNFIYLRKGLIGVDYHCFPTYKLQQTQFKQHLLMKRSKLASVKFVLASGSLTIPMIKATLAYKLINTGLYQVESTQRSWM